MPRAYWLEEGLSYQIAVIEPSEYQFERILRAFRRRQESNFDMEIVNDLYARDCIIIHYRTYDLLTGEFRKKDHHRYLGSTVEKWDAKKILAKAKYVHFFDWPYPKSWLPNSKVKRLELQPDCDGAESENETALSVAFGTKSTGNIAKGVNQAHPLPCLVAADHLQENMSGRNNIFVKCNKCLRAWS